MRFTKIIFTIITLLITSCSTYQSKTITVPLNQDEITWSRAHNYILKYSTYNFIRQTQYVISNDPQESGKITISRQYNPNNTVTYYISTYGFSIADSGSDDTNSNKSYMDRKTDEMAMKMWKNKPNAKTEKYFGVLERIVTYLKTGE